MSVCLCFCVCGVSACVENSRRRHVRMCVSILTQVACAYVCGHERMCVGMCVCVCACMEDSLRRHVRMCVRVHGELTREACYCRRAPRRGFVVCATPLSPLLSFLHVRGMHIMPHAHGACYCPVGHTRLIMCVFASVCACALVGRGSQMLPVAPRPRTVSPP